MTGNAHRLTVRPSRTVRDPMGIGEEVREVSGPVRPRNLRGDSDKARSEWAVGSLPVGSWVELYNLGDQLIYRGYVERQSPWGGYTVVVPVTEGDGNYAGAIESGSLYRLYGMSDHHYVQEHAPVTWLGVDEELATELALAEVVAIGRLATKATDGIVSMTPIRTRVSLVPVVSLIPEEVE